MADYFDLEPGRAYASDVPVLDRPAAVEDGVAFAPDGRPLAVVRQRRKLMPTR